MDQNIIQGTFIKNYQQEKKIMKNSNFLQIQYKFSVKLPKY